MKARGTTLPCFYSFLPTKESVSYQVMFSDLKMDMGENFPSVFNVDYELAVINVLSEAFPETRVQGCVVHFKRALRRNENPERVENFNEALDNFVTYFELTWLGRPKSDGTRRKPRFLIPTWSIKFYNKF